MLLPNAASSVADSEALTSDVLEALKDCPTKSYILVEQQGVSSADYEHGRSSPHLSRYMSGKHDSVRTTAAVTEVVGQVDAAAIMAHLQTNCASREAGQHADAWLQRLVLEVPLTSKAHRIHKLQSDGNHNPRKSTMNNS